MEHAPDVGHLVRVGGGSIPWKVTYVAEIGDYVMVQLSSTESGMQRSELPSNLEPY